MAFLTDSGSEISLPDLIDPQGRRQLIRDQMHKANLDYCCLLEVPSFLNDVCKFWRPEAGCLHLICGARRTGFHNICKQPYKLNNSTSPQRVIFSVETPLHTLASGKRGRITEGIFVRIKCKIPFVIKCCF